MEEIIVSLIIHTCIAVGGDNMPKTLGVGLGWSSHVRSHSTGTPNAVGNICPTGRGLKTGIMMPCRSRRSDVLGSGGVNPGHGSIMGSNGAVKTTSPLVDLLDRSAEDDVPRPNLSGGDVPQDLLGIDLTPASSQSCMNQAQKSGTDVLLDLLSTGTPTDILSPPSAPSTQILSGGSSSTMDLLDSFPPISSMPDGNGPAYPSIVAFESNSLKVTFNFSKQQGNPQTVIEAHFSNKSPNVYTDFIFQAAVPKFLQLHLEPASSNTLPASGNESITQKFTNSQNGKHLQVIEPCLVA
ncbi:membrane traffic protein [Lithospermum erythrorhizon]|uniref:Membrane traffic protein n=1 Tax=Lithospermum erythrorhizon TaxID=34254 RepID=A0AAV3RPP1_LITER